MDFEAVLFLDNRKNSKEASTIQSSIDWLLQKGFENYVNHFSDKKFPINLLDVLKNNNFLDGNDLLKLFGHIEILNEKLLKDSQITNNRPQSICYTQQEPISLMKKFTKDRWSCNFDSTTKSNQAGLYLNNPSISNKTSNENDRLHESGSKSFREMNHRNTQPHTLGKDQKQDLYCKINQKSQRETNSQCSGNSFDESKNVIGCTKHRSLTTVEEQSVNDEIAELANQIHPVIEQISQFSSVSDSNSFLSLNSKPSSVKTVDRSKSYVNFINSRPNEKHSSLTSPFKMKSNKLSNTVPEISLVSDNFPTPNVSSDSVTKSVDCDYLLPINNNLNLRVSNDIPRSTGSNRRFFNSWGYDFELDSGVEELSNDSIDMGEAGRINFRTGSFMTRYRRNSKLSNNSSSPRSGLISPSQPCVNWAWCKDDSRHSMIDNVDDELNPVLDSLFSDMDSLDNFRNILQNRRTSSHFEGFGNRDSFKKDKKDFRPKDFNIRKTACLSINKSNTGDKIGEVNMENINEQSNTLCKQNAEGKGRKSSTKKSASARKRNHPFRWSSLARTNHPVNSCRDIEFSYLSLNQFLILKKLGMLRLTSLLELYIPSQKSQFNWKFPKLLSQKSKFTDTSTDVFGASLTYWQSKIGQPLPPAIYHALKYIRLVGPESDGIFRRAGGKARINELKKEIERNTEMTDFTKWQPYDVADMIKSYFRSLPECLLTNKFSNTLISVKTYIPEQHWFEAIQWVIINLPDENRLVLQSLLYFLADLTKHSKTTQMTSYNLAVCLSPSLFHSPHVISSSSVSPIRMKKSNHGPDLRELEDQKATHQCLKFMIEHAPSLFRLTEDKITKARIQMEFERTISLSKLLHDCNDWFSWIRTRVDVLMNEYNHKFKNWTSLRKDILKIHCDKNDIHHGFELFYKKNISSSDKSGEGLNTIGTWRISGEIDTNAAVILDKIQYKRHEWDPEIGMSYIKTEISDSVDICYMEVASNPPQSNRRMNLIRGCQRNIDEHTNVLVTQSVDDNNVTTIENKPLKQLVSEEHNTKIDDNYVNVIQEDVIIEYFPANQKSRINWLSRVDLRGYSSEWYFRQWSHVLIRRLIHLKIACAQIKI